MSLHENSMFEVIVLIKLNLFIDCSEGDVRLVGGAHKFQGTVEICLDGSWCLVSQHGWDNRDARIVCRELGGYNPSGKFTIKIQLAIGDPSLKGRV